MFFLLPSLFTACIKTRSSGNGPGGERSMFYLYLFKSLRHVAPCAVEPEVAAVNIIVLMATVAGRLYSDLLHRPVMTGLANQPLVGPVQFEVSLFVMVVPPELPAVRVMAGPAFNAETLFVLIVGLMALHTFQGSVLVGGMRMAPLARRDGVKPYQREPGNVMVEKHLLHPAPFIMTALATLALLGPVNVIVLMAFVTRCAELLLICPPPVTGVAVDLLMLEF